MDNEREKTKQQGISEIIVLKGDHPSVKKFEKACAEYMKEHPLPKKGRCRLRPRLYKAS